MAVSSLRVHRQWRRAFNKLRGFCTADMDKYLELKQLKDIKSQEFYDQHSQKHRYFYYIDLQGRLFLEDARPKNIATSLKSAKFLRFFFSQVRPNNISQCKEKEEEELLEYGFRSPCGKEMNFIKCADRPFVFEDLRRDDNSGEWKLGFGGGALTMPFLPDTLRVSLSTGRLYHDVETKHVAAGTPEGVALVRSQLAVELGKHINLPYLPNDIDARHDVKSIEIGDFKWCGQRFAIYAID